MELKVSDLLTLPILRDGQVIAGVGGLPRQVRAVSFNDDPIVFSAEEYALTAPGDLYIFDYANVIRTITEAIYLSEASTVLETESEQLAL